MIRFGVSFGHNDFNLENLLQKEYNCKTIKNYGIVGKVNLKSSESVSSDVSCQTASADKEEFVS